MELTISGHTSWHVDGQVTIDLPEWMVLLSPEELEEAKANENRQDLVFAVGRHSSGDIVVLTGAGELRELRPDSHEFPDGPVRPSNGGRHVTVGDDYMVSACFIIANADNLLFLGSMAAPEGQRVSYVDYRDENNAGTIEATDP